MALTVCAIAALAVISKQLRPLGIAVLLSAICYFILSTTFIIPKLFNMEQYIPSGGYGYDYLGSDIPGMIAGVFKNPSALINTIFTLSRFKYIMILLLSVAFTPILAVDVLLAGLPAILINVISANPEQIDPYSMYVGPVIPFFVAGAIVGLGRISSYLRKKAYNVNRIIVMLLLLISSINVLMLIVANFPANYLPTEHRIASQRAIAAVPENVSITATPNFLPHLAKRRYLFDILQRRESEYFLLETNSVHWITQWLRQNGEYQRLIENLKNDSNYELVFDDDGILLYKHVE